MIQIASHDLRALNQKPVYGAMIDWTHPLSRGLIGCLLMNEGSGRRVYNAVPGSGGGGSEASPCSATLFRSDGTNPATTVWTVGKFGPAWSGDGSKDYIAWGNAFPAIVSANICTVSAWVNPASVNVNQIAASYRDSSVGGNLFFQLDRNNADMRIIWGKSPYSVSTYSSVLVANRWFHTVGTVNVNITQVFVNSVAAAAGTGGSTPTTAPNALHVGAGQNGGVGVSGQWAGSIDHVMIWNRVLSQPEISWLYQEPFAMFRPTVPRHSPRAESGVPARSFAVIVG